MNIHTTHAADGLERRAFTIRDIEQMVEAGVIDRDERFELIGGEIVPMSPKGIRHERLKQWLNYQLIRGLSDDYRTIPETTFRLSEDTFLEPDFVVYPTEAGLEGLKGNTCLLAIEVADSSLAYDRGRKSEIYASFGIVELWVMDVNTMTTHMFRKPTRHSYSEKADMPVGAQLVPLFDEGFSINLEDYS